MVFDKSIDTQGVYIIGIYQSENIICQRRDFE